MSKLLNTLTKKVILGATTLALGVVFISGHSHARTELAFTVAIMASYSCSDATYGTTGVYWQENITAAPRTVYRARSEYTTTCQTGDTSNASGAVVTATQTLTAATAQTVSMISSRIATARQESAMRKDRSGLSVTSLNIDNDLGNGHVGLAGGNHSKGIGVWAQGKWTDVDYTATAFAFKGDVTTGMFGIDKSFKNGKFIIGISGGMEDQDFDTTFNGGTLDGDGYMVAPYMSLNLKRGFSIDATIGMADLDYDTTRKDTGTAEIFSGTTEGDRTFGAVAINFSKSRKFKKGVASIGLSVGMNKSEETKDAYTETGTTGTTVAVAKNTSKITQTTVGGEVAFLIMNRIEPFINYKMEWDSGKSSAHVVGATQVQPTVDDQGSRLGGGINLFLGQRGTATVSYEEVHGRADYDESSVTGRLRLNF
jgi:hypothetical protein